VNPSLRRQTVAGAVGLLLMAGSVRADDGKDDAYEPKARQLLSEVAKTYRDLPAYSDQGELAVMVKQGAIQQKGTSKRSVTFARPNKLSLDYGAGRLVSDGKDLTAVQTTLKRYSVTRAPSTVDTHAITGLALPANVLAPLFGGEVGLPVSVVLDLLGSDDAVKPILEGTDGLKLEPDAEVEGNKVRSLLVDQTEGPDIRMLIDPESKLVRQIDLVYTLEEINAKAREGQKIDGASVTWKAGTIARAVPKDAFSTVPPVGFEKVEPAAPERPQDADKSLVDGLVGKPAPDFTLTVLDREGKTKTVSKADLKGKVVLIDFWATWCGPCLKELPEVQKLVDAYAQAKKDVVVVAVSEDDDPSDPSDLRELVEKTLADQKLKLTDGPVSMVALDPKRTIGDAFKVEALPTVVILDAQGVVQAAHVGYSPNVREVLTKDIDRLLDGKSSDPDAKTKD
jgi:thiol-disulfide isomerase/thioredoxin